MPWVRRDDLGVVNGVFGSKQPPGVADEFVNDGNPEVLAFLASLFPPTVLLQDIILQFNQADAVALRNAIANSAQAWLLWAQMQAYTNQVPVTNPRFRVAWNGLVTVLGQARMNQIAANLGVTIPSS